jgi:Rab11 family-interacting protein 3/4
LIEAQNVVIHTQEAHRNLEEVYRRDQEDWDSERQANSHVVEELTRELEEVRNSREEQMTRESKVEQSVGEDVFSDLPARIADMETEIRILREQNKRMNESNEELQAQMLNKGLDEGMKIMQETHNSSLAAEFEAMSENEMRKALQDQQEVNSHLRGYIDNVLLNIMEKYPELLEVRARK